MSDRLAVRGILSSSQVEPPQLVPPTALGNVYTSDGFCSSHRNMGRQHRARVRGISLAYLTSRLTLCAQPHLPWSFCCVVRSSFHWVVCNKCSANHLEACSTIILGQPACAMEVDSRMARIVSVVVQGA